MREAVMSGMVLADDSLINLFRFRDEVVAMSRRQRRRAFWGNVLLCVLCVAAMVLVGVLVGGMGGSV